MPYDPTIGKWMEQDPAAYIDGSNTYQMELGDPTAIVDPEGTKGISVNPTEDSLIVDLPDGGHVTLLNGVQGTIYMYPDYTAVDTDDQGLSDTHLRSFELKLSAKTGCTQYHWLQFVRREVTDAKGKQISGVYSSNNAYLKLGETYVDSLDAVNPFYDARGISELTDATSAILDQPGVVFILDDFKKSGGTTSRAIFDDFLVSDSGQVFYQVHWERVGHLNGDSEYENVGGDPISTLPGWASADELLSGYSDANATSAQPNYTNPVGKPFRGLPE